MSIDELLYSLDASSSQYDDALAIKIQAARRNGSSLAPLEKQPLLNLETLQQLATARDATLLPFLLNEAAVYRREKKQPPIDKRTTPLHTLYISHRSAHQALKLFATTGKLMCNSKALVIDLHTPCELYYVCSDSIEARLRSGADDFPIRACDLIGRGPPHFFVKGISLKCISTAISWKDLKAAFAGTPRSAAELIAEAKEDPEAPRVTIEGDISAPAVHEPLPILILKDKTGAFARLHLDYGGGIEVDFHDPSPTSQRRQRIVEAGWERDLLETDYLKKHVGNTHYYCPLDKVSKALAFLLDIGWTVRDWKGNTVYRHKEVDLAAEMQGNTIAVKGKVRYDTFEADLSTVVGAFNRRERFVEIAPGKTALLPDTWEKEAIGLLGDAGEIVADGIRLKRTDAGLLAQLADAAPTMRLTEEVESLKQQAGAFSGFRTVLPGPNFCGSLRPYQQQGVDWLHYLRDFRFNGLLADDMGLGKTVQLIAFLSTLTLVEPVLIVVPTSLLFNWKNELQRFLPSMPMLLHHGPARTAEAATLNLPQVILTSYATLRLDRQLLSQVTFDCLVLDEAQAIKNASTQTFHAAASLHAKLKVSVTGTPVENSLMELWAHFHFLMPDLFGDEKSFQAEVQAGQSDPRFLRRIQQKIRPFLLRRRKEAVAQDLPERIDQVVWVEMGDAQRALYDAYVAGIKSNLLVKVRTDGIEKHRMEVLEAILRLRQLCCHPLLVGGQEAESAKLDLLMQELETLIAEGRKILVYSQFTTMLALLRQRIAEAGWEAATLDGTTRNREAVVEAFQSDPNLKIFLISLKAGGTGLNLTAADYVMIFDPWWNDAVENQAIGRAHRIGRSGTVIAKRYLMAETIEEKMVKLKGAKSALAADLIDSSAESASPLSADDLLFLIN